MTKAAASRPIHRSLLAALGALATTAVLLTSQGSASAPEPADLKAPLTGSTGATAAAVYTYSGVNTTVRLWPTTFTGGSVPVGTPCSPFGLTTGRVTRTIQANSTGTQRRCV